MSTAPAPPLHQEFTFADVFLVLRRRSSFILITALVCFTAGVLLCIFMPRSYKATGKLQVAKQSADDLRLEGMKGDEESSSDALEESIALQTQANILQSDTLALHVIEKLNLEHTADFKPMFNPLGWLANAISPAGPKDVVGASLENSPRRLSSLLKTFQKNLKVDLVPGTQLIEIVYRSRSPRTASDVVNELMKGLGDFTFQTRYDATVQASQWLNGQMNDLKKQAEESQAKVVQLQRNAGVYSLGSTDANGQTMAYSATLDRLQQATLALTQATSNRILKGGIYEVARSGDPEAISSLAGSSLSGSSPGVNNAFSLLQNLRTQQATLEIQVASDGSKYGDANPKLQDERASLASINAAIHDEVKRIGDRANNDYRAALIAEKNTRADYETQRAAADQLNDKAVEYTIARQEADGSRNLYDTLYQHLKEAGVIEGFRSSNLSIVDPARIPARPARPNVPIYLALSLIGGLFLGGVGALFIDSVDGRIQSLSMIEYSLKTPLLGVIPIADFSIWHKNDTLTASELEHRKKGLLFTPSSETEITAELNPQPGAAFLEALGSLHTTLLLSRSTAPPRTVLITSAAESEGKTTIALYLAALLARNNSKVLLVEGDMRCPTLSRRLSLPETKGLSNLLSGHSEDLVTHPFRTLPELAVLFAGPPPPYPAVLLGSERMRDLLAGWSKQYDFVLIDTPSTLAVTDATVLAHWADFTLLVARHAQSSRKSLERAYRTLRFDPTTQVGVVVNGVHRGSSAYKEYFGYAGDKYYGTKKRAQYA